MENWPAQSFKKYITYKRDFNELLLHLLRGLVADAVRFEELVSRSNVRLTEVDVKMEDMEMKVRIMWSLCHSNHTWVLYRLVFRFLDGFVVG